MYIPRLKGNRIGAAISTKILPPIMIQGFDSSVSDISRHEENAEYIIKYANKRNHNIKIKKSWRTSQLSRVVNLKAK